MELTLAEEIRALLEMHEKESPQPRGKCFMQFWCAFPALAAKMLAVISERDELLRRWELIDRQAAAARIAELKEDAVRWETRYRGAMEQFTEERNYHIHTLKEMQAAQNERDRLRWEAECLQVTVAK